MLAIFFGAHLSHNPVEFCKTRAIHRALASNLELIINMMNSFEIFRSHIFMFDFQTVNIQFLLSSISTPFHNLMQI